LHDYVGAPEALHYVWHCAATGRLMRFEAEKEFKKAELRKPIGIFSNQKVKKDRKTLT
jgi:hypothetical protein